MEQVRQMAEAGEQNERGHRVGRFIRRIGDTIAIASGEYLLAFYPNGGTVVFLRALHVTIIVVSLGILLHEALDPTKEWVFSALELRVQLQSDIAWIGPIFAAVYALLYARFASQWTYMANLYNQIKTAQARRDAEPQIIAEWKAGFIEDCLDLHLLRKPMFASIASEWLSVGAPGGKEVRECFASYTSDGKNRLKRIDADLADALSRNPRRARTVDSEEKTQPPAPGV